MKLLQALERPEVAPIVAWYRSADPDETLNSLDAETQSEVEHDGDAAIGHKLAMDLADALPGEETLAERLVDFIIYNVR